MQGKQRQRTEKTYYHTTEIENIDDIMGSGLAPRKSDKTGQFDETLQHLFGVYVFDNIGAARSFGQDQNRDYAIFLVYLDEFDEFEDYELIVDTEYKSGAYMIHTDEWINDVELIEVHSQK